MTDRPILFSAPMVRAILDGRKTQTRRVLAVKGARNQHNIFNGTWADDFVLHHGNAKWRAWYIPYGIGDRLWVRETWSGPRIWSAMRPADRNRCGSPQATEVYYWADGTPTKEKCWENQRPSIHMPRWASRLTLTVTDVRIERVQDISEANAIAEGMAPVPMSQVLGNPFTEAFRGMWDDLNAHRGYGWEANPWVAAITFTAEQRNIDAEAAP